MAQLPEKLITTVNKITSIPSNTNLFINANGELRQATINNIVKASSVVSDAVINAVKENIDNQFNTVQGSPLLITDGADGNVTSFTTYGRSEQKQYSGKNFIKPTITSRTLNGVTFKRNDDDSWSVKGTAIADNTFCNINYIDTNTCSVPNGSYILTGGKDNVKLQLYQDGKWTNTSLNGNPSTVTMASTTSNWIRLEVENGVTVNTTVYPMLRLADVADDTYEPFTGNAPSPSPEYPQDIVSVGDSGWFDGELLHGVYNSNGSYSANSSYICSKNPIPCNENDAVKIMYEDTASVISVRFYSEDMAFVSSLGSTNISDYEFEVPTNAKYLHFNIAPTGSSFAVADAKHICVTINDTYALIQKRVNKNLLPNTATTQTIGNVTYTVNNDKSVTANANETTTANTYFNVALQVPLNAGTYILNGCPSGGSTTTYNIYVKNSSGAVIAYNTGSDISFTLDSADTIDITITIKVGVKVNNLTFYPMLRPIGTDDTYVQHESKTTYIPLTEPLRGITVVADSNFADESGQMWTCDEIKAIDNVYSANRNTVSLIADGTNIKFIRYNTTETDLYYFDNSAIKAKVQHQGNLGEIISSHYTTSLISDFTQPDLTCRLANNNSRIYVVDKRFSTADDFNAWLAENPVEFIVERAKPLVEPFADQTPFYNIKTFDGVTHISASDDADMVVEYPTSRSAGIASIGWAKGNLAEIKMEQLSAQILEVQIALLNV